MSKFRRIQKVGINNQAQAQIDQNYEHYQNVKKMILAIIFATIASLVIVFGLGLNKAHAAENCKNGEKANYSCVLAPKGRVQTPVRVTCAEALAPVPLRTQDDGGQIAIIPSKDGGYCVKTPKGIFHYLYYGWVVDDLKTGQKCEVWKSKEGFQRMFWREAGVIKSKNLK